MCIPTDYAAMKAVQAAQQTTELIKYADAAYQALQAKGCINLNCSLIPQNQMEMPMPTDGASMILQGNGEPDNKVDKIAMEADKAMGKYDKQPQIALNQAIKPKPTKNSGIEAKFR